MRRINYILLSLFLLVGFSCVKDALKTDFKELDEITITGMEKRYDITLGGEINITPTITSKFGATDADFDYIWYKYNLSAGSTADTLCFEKNLSVKIDDVSPGIQHFITLKVIDKKDKTFTLQTAQLYTSSEYSNGVVALVKADNQVDLSFIKNGQDVVSNNLFSLTNDGQKLSSTSFHLMSVDAILSIPAIYRRILVSTGDENIGLYLSAESFATIDKVSDLFFTPVSVSTNCKLKATYNSQGEEYLLIDDKLYNRTMNRYDNENTPKFNAAPIPCVASPTNFSLATFAFTPEGSYGSPIVFDNSNGRFMMHKSGAKAYSFLTNSTDGTAFAVFDPAKLPGLSMVCGGYFSDDSSDNMWGLMKDASSGNYRVISMQYYVKGWSSIFKTLENKEITRTMAPKLYEATKIKSASYSYVAGVAPWAFEMRGLKNMFLYVVNNKLYVYNIASDYEGLLIDGDAEGFTIDDVFVHRTYLTVTEDGSKEYFSRIALAIRDKQGSGKTGGVAYYKVNVLGGVSATQYFKKTGFCDQVLSLDEKIN